MEMISTREKSGVKILKDVFGIDAINVLDPTLLHKGYDELTGEIKEKNTLAFYPLSGFPELEQYCKKLAAELGLDFVNINKMEYLIRRVVWNRPGVEEWVRSIAEARFVVTPSFHGLAFSLIYHKPFVVIQNHNGGPVKTRIMSLLEQLGLEDRFFTSIEDFKKSDILQKPVDYEAVDRKLAELREVSYNFLRNLSK